MTVLQLEGEQLDRFDVLARHAADLGLDIAWTRTLPEYIHGYYEDDSKQIVLNDYCTMAQVLSVLAHEIGHGVYGDRCSTEAVERRADEMGASLMITRDEYAEAEQQVGCHAGALARHLGVTRDIIVAWRRWWLHTGLRVTRSSDD